MSSVPSVSVPLEEGEIQEQITLQEYANQLATELHRVKSIIEHVSTEEIGARIEECKLAMAMYKRLFEMLVTEHTRRFNIDPNAAPYREEKDDEDEFMTDI